MIRKLGVEDVAAFVAIRSHALRESPLTFSASPQDDFAGSADAVEPFLRRGDEWVIIGAFEPDLVGTIGLFRDRHRKARHKAHIWGFYVASTHRGKGIGAALLSAAITHARTLAGVTRIQLSVTSVATAACALYERAGFVTWGIEPDALRHKGSSASEHHMLLVLKQQED